MARYASSQSPSAQKDCIFTTWWDARGSRRWGRSHAASHHSREGHWHYSSNLYKTYNRTNRRDKLNVNIAVSVARSFHIYISTIYFIVQRNLREDTRVFFLEQEMIRALLPSVKVNFHETGCFRLCYSRYKCFEAFDGLIKIDEY